jgi:hypothetical protein
MTPDVAGVISLNLSLAPVDDNVTAESMSQSHKVTQNAFLRYSSKVLVSYSNLLRAIPGKGEMAKYDKSSPTAIHAQTSYHHGVNC